MREGQPGRGGGGLDRAELLAGVPAVVVPVTGWDMAPGQVLDLGIQAELVLLHDQDVAGVLLGDQEFGVVALGVHRIGGDRAPGQVRGFQQRREGVAGSNPARPDQKVQVRRGSGFPLGPFSIFRRTITSMRIK